MPGDEPGPLLAALGVGLLPQWQFIGHALSNDGSAAVAGALLTYAAVCYVTGRPVPWTLAAGAALAVVTKMTAAALLPGLLIGTLLLARRRRAALLGFAAAAGAAAVTAVGIAALAPPVWRALVQDFSRRAAAADAVAASPAVWALLGRRSLQSFWGLFGWLNVPAPAWTYGLGASLALAAALGLPVALVTVHEQRRPAALLLLVAGAAVAGFAANLRGDPQPQGRLLYGGLTAAATLAAMGWRGLLPRAPATAAAAALTGLLFAANAEVWRTSLPQAYDTWRHDAVPVAARLAAPERAVAVRLGDGGRRARQTFVASGPVALVAVAVQAVSGDGAATLRLRADGAVVAERVVALDALAPGDWVGLAVPGGGTRAAAFALEIDLTEAAGRLRLWGTTHDAYPAGSLTADGGPTGGDLSLVAFGPGALDRLEFLK
jgi:hypothetical protein